eukprot:scaffold5981_cov146-Skeletonema_dohrnii-CCMP3373.AAC.1
MVPPFVIIIAFGMIYWSVRKQEKKNGRYGAGTLNLGASAASSSNGNDRDSNTRGSARSSIGSIRSSLSSISSRFRRNSSGNNDSNSRAVMHRAFAYAIAYFATWIWALIGEIMTMLKKVENIPLWYHYIWTIMIPLQGMFNFLVYFHPMVKSAGKKASREGKDLWYIQAFGKALLKGLGIEGCQCCTKKEKNSQSATMTDTSAAPTASTCRRSSLFEQVLEEEKVDIDIDIEAAPEPEEEEDDEFSTLDQRLEHEKVDIDIEAAPEEEDDEFSTLDQRLEDEKVDIDIDIDIETAPEPEEEDDEFSKLDQRLEEEKVDIDIEAAPEEVEDDEFSTLDQRLEEEKVNIGIDAAPEDCGSD